MKWVAVGLLCAVNTWAHGVHASLASVDYNSQTKSFEITVVMTADDIETLLRRDTGRQIELDRTPDAEKLVFNYLRKTIEIRARSGQAVPLQWVGMEVRTAKLTAYVEAKMDGVLSGLRIKDELLFDLLPDQMNMLSVKRDHKGKSSDHLFAAKDAGSWQIVTLESSQ